MAQDRQDSVPDPEDELVQAARRAPEGDLRAFETLVHLHRRRILADCQYLTRDPGSAEDLAQEVFVKAFFALAGFEGRSSFRHWLQRIKVNHCLNHMKKREALAAVDIDEAAPEAFPQLRLEPAAEKMLEEMDDRRKIGQVLNAMPDTLRVPLILADMDELSYDEIAAALGVGLSAVKMRIKRARERFRELYSRAAEASS